MAKISKVSKEEKRERTRMRVRFYRSTQAILRQNSKSIEVLSSENKHGGANESNDILSKKWRDNFVKDIRKWAIEFNATNRSVTGLLKILNARGMKFFPTDSRALLKTPRNIETVPLAGGHYWHHGIKKSVEKIFCQLNEDIEIGINVNVDGLPLFRSSKVEFWPILANIHGIEFLELIIYFEFSLTECWFV